MTHRHLAARPLRRLAFLAATVILLTLAGPVRAAEDADLDLKPADFMPDEPLALRVDDLHAAAKGTAVEVTVLNRTAKAVSATVDCTLYDGEREELGTASAAALDVGPGERAKATLTAKADGASRAYCEVIEAP